MTTPGIVGALAFPGNANQNTLTCSPATSRSASPLTIIELDDSVVPRS
jgi:hypothetical protein